MSVASGDLIKAVQSCTLPDNSLCQNAFYWQASFAAGQTDAAVMDRIETFVEDFYGEIVSLIPNVVTFGELDITRLEFNEITDTWETWAVLGTRDPTITPTASDDPLPNACAATISASTQRPKSRGRKALPAFAETFLDDNDLTTAAATAVASAAAEWLADLTISAGNDLVPAIYRRGVEVILPLLVASIPSVIGSMRSRKPGVGA